MADNVNNMDLLDDLVWNAVEARLAHFFWVHAISEVTFGCVVW